MGQEVSQEEKDRLDAENFVNDPRYISWDEKGNLRYGMVHPVGRNQQKLEILKLDFVDNEDGKVWYIMDSAWIASWLAYVHFNVKNAPAPGPCSNSRLISYDYNEKKWGFRWGLMMAVKDRGGDYRRVSEEVWRKYCEYYPGSGPAITMIYSSAENQNGFFPTTAFTIMDAVPDPEDKDLKKGKKKRFPNLFSKNNKNQEGTTLDSNAESKENGESKDDKFISEDTGKATGPAAALLKSGAAREHDSDDDSDSEHHAASDLAAMLKSNNTRVDSKIQSTASANAVPYQKVVPEAKPKRQSKDSDKDYEKMFGFTT